MRENRECNLNSVDIYCQEALIHKHPLLHGAYSAPAGRRLW